MEDDGMVKVSVILPFYNAETTLARALQSVVAQTMDDFECLLVDNNSTDNSHHIAREFTQRDSRFILLAESRQGVAYASNCASEHAKGEYITRMDADDWMPPDRLMSQADFLDDHPDYQVISGRVKYMAHHEQTEGFERYVNWVNSLMTHQQIYLNQFIESPIVNPTAMWRRTTAEKLGMYRHGDFPEDYELWLRWLNQGVNCHKLDDIVLHWYDSDHRLTRIHPNYSEEAFYRIKTRYLAEWLKKNNPHHPKVAIWGASRLSRKRADLLRVHGIVVDYYIDIHDRRKLDEEIVHYSMLPNPEEAFILVYLGNEKARQETSDYLTKCGFSEGIQFLNV